MKISPTLWMLVLLTAAIAASVVVGPKLPEIVPTHWNAVGLADRHGDKAQILWAMPGVMVLMGALTFVLPKLSPEKFKIEPFMRTYGIVMILVQALFLGIHLLLLRAAGGAAQEVAR